MAFLHEYRDGSFSPSVVFMKNHFLILSLVLGFAGVLGAQPTATACQDVTFSNLILQTKGPNSDGTCAQPWVFNNVNNVTLKDIHVTGFTHDFLSLENATGIGLDPNIH